VVGKEVAFLQKSSESGKGLHEVHRSYLSLVILHLHQNDYVAADKTYSQALGYGRKAISSQIPPPKSIRAAN